MEPQVSSQLEWSHVRCRSRSPYKTWGYFRRLIRVMAELFAYRVVLNGIVLARSTQEVVFTGYMTYRASALRSSNEPFLSNEKHLGRRLKCSRLPPDPLN